MESRIQNAIHQLIKRFTERQRIVLDAMRDLRPDMILPLESKIDPQARTELMQQYARSPSNGRWREWEYRLHGIGCHLTHVHTGEVIGWDIGSLKRFDWMWFVDYVAWLLTEEQTNAEAQIILETLQGDAVDRHTLRELIFPIIEQLESDGILRREQENRYTLIKPY